jgi:hypothetical protein
MPTIHMTWRLLNRIFVQQFTTFSSENCKKFREVCLKEFRQVSQQRADIFNIYHDCEHDINYFM